MKEKKKCKINENQKKVRATRRWNKLIKEKVVVVSKKRQNNENQRKISN